MGVEVDSNIPADERHDITIPRNAGLRILFALTNVDAEGVETVWDLTNHDIYAQVRKRYDDSEALLEATVVDRVDAAGTFALVFSATSAQAIGNGITEAVWDAVVVPPSGGMPVRICAGLVKLSRGVTRIPVA